MSQWASQSTIIKLVAVSRRLEQMAEHVGELWDDKVLGSKMSTCRLVQQRQREAVCSSSQSFVCGCKGAGCRAKVRPF